MEEITEQINDEDDGIEHIEVPDILEFIDRIENTKVRDILEFIVNTIEGGRRKADGSLPRFLESLFVPGERPCTIDQVHKVLRQLNEKCYEPQLVSIGPYHRGKEGLKSMEAKKFQYLLELLSRNPELKFEDFVKEIKKLKTKARKCYSESIGLESKEFVEMMVLDGCFLVEIFLRISNTKKFNDELWLPLFISGDMLLLENQLPFFVLESIYRLVRPIKFRLYGPIRKGGLLKRILKCFKLIYVLPLRKDADWKESYHHVLDIVHHHCLPKRPSEHAVESSPVDDVESSSGDEGRIGGAIQLYEANEPWRWSECLDFSWLASSVAYIRIDRLLRQLISKWWPTNSEGRLFSIPSAEELEEAGIEFQRKETEPAGSFLDVEFDKKGVLKIPFLHYSSSLQTIFQNLIAYEQCDPKAGTFFIGYGLFMDDLINTAKDVRILCRAGILENALGSNDQLAQHFNDMSRRIYAQVEAIHLYRERRAINEYCRKKWPTWRAKLMRDYLNSPWAIVSLIAVVLLLLLTITQTVFSIIPNV